MPNYLQPAAYALNYLNTFEGDRFSYKYIELPVLNANQKGFTIYCEDYWTSSGVGTLPIGVGVGGELLSWDGSLWVAAINGYNVQIFSTPGTFIWNRPNRISEYDVLLVGSGGSGGAGRKGAAASLRSGGSGGGGAPIHRVRDYAVSGIFPGTTETVIVGDSVAGGASQTANSTTGASGLAGNASQWGYMRVTGGNAGSGGGTTAAGAVALLGGTPINFFNASIGVAGGVGSTSATITVTAAAPQTACAPATGGSGGGISAANNGQWGGNGGRVGNGAVGTPSGLSTSTTAANTQNSYSANGVAGLAGTSLVFPFFSGSGGSGGSSSDPTNTASNGGNGGAGGNYGGGGGGGGACTDGTGNSGAGGASGSGLVIVYSRY